MAVCLDYGEHDTISCQRTGFSTCFFYLFCHFLPLALGFRAPCSSRELLRTKGKSST